VGLRLVVGPSSAALEVADDGRGFSPGAGGARSAGLGLFIMQERAALLDGRVRVDSRPGEGTCIVAEFPLRRTSDGSPPEAA
jgi:signal transduction histidine kinase